MLRAVTYARVSTDEQKENGFSLQEQDAQLFRHCQQNELDRIEHLQDDHSAKDFNRPGFNELMRRVKNKTLKFDVFLTTKVDRFSRDVFESWAQLKIFAEHKIKVFTIQEGEIDFTNPAKFFPNLIQQGAAHYDNLLRADNTIRGMRQAAREGRCMGRAPKCYKNNPFTKFCEIDSEIAPLIVDGFQQMATGLYAAEEVRRTLSKKGLKCSKNNFINILKNPFYMGKIVIKKWKDEPEELRDGLHQALIDDELFNEVQNVLTGNRKKISINVTRKASLPLRGFLKCKLCGSKWTGSPSKSRNGNKYFYYHCQRGCKERFRADLANNKFEEHLTTIQFPEEALEAFNLLVRERFMQDDKEKESKRKSIDLLIEKVKSRLASLEDKVLDNLIDPVEYKPIKRRLDEEYNDLVMQVATLSGNNKLVNKQVTFALSLLSDLSSYYMQASVEVKQKLVGSIFPESLTFSENNYRTTRVNEVIALLTNSINGFSTEQKGRDTEIGDSPSLAPRLGLEPRTLRLTV